MGVGKRQIEEEMLKGKLKLSVLGKEQNTMSLQITIACSSQNLLDSQKEIEKGIVLQVGQLWMRRGKKANVASINAVLLDSQEELIELSNI